MFRILAIVLFAMFLAHSAEASGRNDLKSGYAALLHHAYDEAIALLTEAIDAGNLGASNDQST